MEAYDRDYWKEPQIHQNNHNMYSPQIKDYLKWMIIPALLGAVTCLRYWRYHSNDCLGMR